MKEHMDKVISWIKEQPIKGCITGSCLLEYFENQDIDVFVYDEKSFIKLLFAMHHNPEFQILDKLEKWKFDKYINDNSDTFYKFGLVTIKFMYNTCIPINVIIKKNCKNIFSILSSFDMDIICKGFDIETKQYLDLSNNPKDKIANWNTWNTKFYSSELWELSRILRQLERCFKYYKRGYNTDKVILKYIELIDRIDEYENIFNSENFSDRLVNTKKNIKIIKEICNLWLENHSITDDEMELLKKKITEI